MPDPLIHTRHTDPAGYEEHARTERQLNPHLWDWEAAYGKASLRGRNLLGAVLLFGLALLASIWYLGLRQESVLKTALASSANEHRDLVTVSQQTTCILALSQQGKLNAFMDDAKSGEGAWARWCWWIRRPPLDRHPE